MTDADSPHEEGGGSRTVAEGGFRSHAAWQPDFVSRMHAAIFVPEPGLFRL